MLTDKSLEIFNEINLFERFKTISLSYQNEPMSDYSNEKVNDILESTGIDFKYFKSEGFYGVKFLEKGYDIRFNLSFKYGIVEPIMWAKNTDTKEQFGGVFSRLIKLIQKLNNEENIIKIMYPKFSNYEELKLIIFEFKSIFEDFKKELLK